MHKLKWDDLHFLLLTAREGSVAGAARLLGVTHTTVARRVQAFEKRQGIRIFDKLSTGYRLTPDGAELMEDLQAIDGAINDMQRRLAGLEERLEGVVRVTTTDTVLIAVLVPHLATFHASHPRIRLELVITNTHLNLTRREADVAIRPSSRPPENLVGQRVSGYGFGIYGSRSYLQRHPELDLAGHAWLGPGDLLAKSPAAQWLREQLPEARIVLRADSFVALHAMTAVGMGLAILPCSIAERSPTLQRLGAPVRELDTDLWVLSHEDLRRSAPVRAFIDHVSTALRGDRPILEGRPMNTGSQPSAPPLDGVQGQNGDEAQGRHEGDGERRTQ